MAEVLSENYPVPLVRVGVQDKFGKSGKPDILLQMYGLTAADIVKSTKAALKKKSDR